EHLAIMVERRGTVDAHAVGGTIVSPQELAVGSREPDESFSGELDVLTLTVEVDGNDRSVGRSRTTPSTSETSPITTTTARASGPAGFPARTRGHLALPDRLAGQFVKGHQHGVLGSGSADDLVTIN